MTRKLDIAQGDRDRARAYFVEFFPPMIGYGLLIGAAALWGGMSGHSPARFAWALLPAIPAAFVIRAVVRHVRRADEFQRRQLLAGQSVGFGVAMLVAVTMGLLEAAGLRTVGDAWFIYVAGMLGWAVTSAALRLR